MTWSFINAISGKLANKWFPKDEIARATAFGVGCKTATISGPSLLTDVLTGCRCFHNQPKRFFAFYWKWSRLSYSADDCYWPGNSTKYFQSIQIVV